MITDLNVYTEPPPPSLPAAGSTVKDPVFGSDIIRVTDSRDGTQLGTYYSYWPTLNSDNTRMLIRNGAGAFIRNFDPVNFKILAKEEFPTIPGVGLPVFEGATWSGADPDTLFITANASLCAYKPSAKSYALLADIQTLIPGEYIKQPSWSRDGNRVGFTRKKYADYSEPGYAVYDCTLKKLVLNDDVPELDEVTISQSGKYLLAKLTQGAGKVESVVHDLDSGTQTPLIDDTDAAPGHGDAGLHVYVGYDNFANRIVLHDLTNPKPFRTLFQFDAWGLGVGHTSMRAFDESWALESFFGGTDATVFRNEVIQIATDGSGKVRRLFHHHSVYRTYYDSPRANISTDGQFVAFTSNWGATDRTDLYVARILVPSVPTTPSTPVATKRKVAWPKTESAQDQVMSAQRLEGYYPAKNLTGAYMEFWKV